MPSIESIIRGINKELIPQFEEKLRSYLVQQDKEWLIEQIIRLSLDAHSLEEMDRKTLQEFKALKRAERAARVREMAFARPGWPPSWRSTHPTTRKNWSQKGI